MGVCIGYSYPCFVFGLARNMRVSDGLGLAGAALEWVQKFKTRDEDGVCGLHQGARGVVIQRLAGETGQGRKQVQARVHNGRGVGSCVSGN